MTAITMTIEQEPGLSPLLAELEQHPDRIAWESDIRPVFEKLYRGNKSLGRDFDIITARTGIAGDPVALLDEVGILHGLTGARVSQIVKKFYEEQAPEILAELSDSPEARTVLEKITENYFIRQQQYAHMGRVATKSTNSKKTRDQSAIDRYPTDTNSKDRETPKARDDNKSDGNVPEDLLDLYFNDMGRIELLTAKEEVKLAQEIGAGNIAGLITTTIEKNPELDLSLKKLRKLLSGRVEEQDLKSWEILLKENPELDISDPEVLITLSESGAKAKKHFVEANLRLVVSIAADFSRRSALNLDNLIQDGNLGLIRAVEKFDWRKGYKFSTYATWWIRQAIQRGTATNERTIRLPVVLHDALVRIKAACSRLEAETGREPTVEELAAAANTNIEIVRRALDGDHKMVSIDKPVGDDLGAATLNDLQAHRDPGPEEIVVNRMFTEGVMASAQAMLDKRSWDVLSRHLGLDGSKPATLDEIGRELNLSREAIRKIEIRALELLKKELLGQEYKVAV